MDGFGAVHGRRGRAVLHAFVPLAAPVRLRRGRGLHADPLRPRVRGADVGDPAAVHGPGLAVGDHGPWPARGAGWPGGVAAGRLALAGGVRHRRRAGRQQQRRQPDLRAAGADPVAALRGVGHPGGPPRPRAGHVRPGRGGGRGLLGLVDRGPAHPGRLRRRHPRLQRDTQDGRERLAGLRGAARSGQLVLLRRGRAGHLDRPVPGLHPDHLGDPHQLHGAAAGPGGCGAVPVGIPGLLRPARARRHHGRGRGLPLREPLAAGRGLPVVRRGVQRWFRPAFDAACRAAGRPRPVGAAGRRARRAGATR